MTINDPHARRAFQARMANLLLTNLLIAVVAPIFLSLTGGFPDYAIAFGVGLVILALVDRRYAPFLFWSLVFVAYLVYEIILSNLAIAWLVLQPKPQLDPGIIAIPLRVNTALEITLLASAITLTPGTLSLDLGRGQDGQLTLYVHSLQVGDPAQFRSTIQNGFERMILRISRGAA
jgi:multicomponent Na+:H+ antiporter subunit E